MSAGMTREQAEAYVRRLAELAEQLADELGIDPEDVALGVNLRVRPPAELIDLTIKRVSPPPPGSTLN